MAISTTSIDYTGRTLDMYICTSPNLITSVSPKVFYSFGQPTRYIAGVQKLIQRYVVGLMNSGFPEEIIASSSDNIQKASHVFNLYSWDVINEFRVYQSTQTGQPTDEQLQTVQLDSVTVVGQTVNFSATLRTVAGDVVQFILPLSIL